jgi:Tol biopolymer transport system component
VQKRFIKYIFFIFCIAIFSQKIAAQGMYTNFGQNRVQYGKFEWSFVRSENFDSYFYSGGRELGTFACRTAEEQLNEIEKIVDHRLSGRVEIICYNTLSDYKQTNFGLTDVPQNTGGYTQVVNNKIFIYFDGNHDHFVQQIKSGMSLVLINELLFGGSIQERLQNAALLNLADWQLFGLTSYLGKDWDVEKDNKMKDIILSKKKVKFNRLVQSDAQLAGHSFWRFLVDKYGVEVVANMIYVTRLSRNFESALVYVTGYDMNQTMKDWLKYYQEQYAKEDANRKLPNNDFKIKKRLRPIVEPQMKVGPKGDYVAFTTNNSGKYKVWLVDTKTNKSKRIHKGGLKYYQTNLDHSFPILSWHPGGDKFSYVHEKKGKVFITTVEIKSKKKETLTFLKFDKITSFSYADNGRTIVLSAIRKGQSDIYVYDMQSRKERQITNDPSDDLYPRFVENSTKIIFSSNRNNELLGAAQSTTLRPDNNFDIFLYDFETGNKKMKRLSNTPNINETQPMDYNTQFYYYLTEYNGIENRYEVRVEEQYDYTELQINYKDTTPTDTLNFETLEPKGESFLYDGKRILLNENVAKIDTIIHNKDVAFTYPITNYDRSILAQDMCRQNQTVYDMVKENGKYYIKYSPVINDVVEESKKVETYPNLYRLKSGFATKPFVTGPEIFNKRQLKTIERVDAPSTDKKIIVDSNAYFFVNDFTPKIFKAEDVKPSFQQAEIKSAKTFKLAAPRFYDVTFFPDHFVTQLDNSVINSYYQPITPGGQNLFNPGLNAMVKLGMVDLLEDYRITAGFRIPLDFNGTDYFLSYETLKKRLDQKLMFYRQVRNGSDGTTTIKSTSHELRYVIKYPFSPVASLRLNVFARQDRDIYQSTSQQSIETPDRLIYWVGFKTEYVYDNTIPKGLNLWNGTRFKIFYERYYNAQDDNVQLNTVGFDFRHYQKIHRQLIFCTRVTYNTSFGQAKVKYVMGGVDNSLFPNYDNSNNTASNEFYAFQALATNMRGFNQNIRNGSSFAVINNEIRFPIFSYLINKPIRSDFISNFQIVPFFDIGTAWTGTNPYSDDNTFNQKLVIVNQYTQATVINVRDPIVAGFGGGLRSKLFGYFIRGDIAWGIQDREVNQKPVFYISMSTDF